jgi:hypothetical protein
LGSVGMNFTGMWGAASYDRGFEEWVAVTAVVNERIERPTGN